MRFRRSEGLTPSERILAELCDRSFLKLWTYPNLFKKPSKELTDLLVVFGRDVIIFSDKSCAYPNTGDAGLDWSRWYKKSIKKSALQIDQAERWLRTYPGEVYLDARCVNRLPVALPADEDMQVHRVCVALNATDRARLATGTAALTVYPTVRNDAEQFTVGRIDQARGWVHVFDETSLAVVLTELSTISDFVHYLSAKEALFDGGRFLFAEAETDIMAYYLWNGRDFPASAEPFRLEPNLWAQVEASPHFLAGREQNQIGIFWDNLIEYVTGHYLNGTLEFGNELQMSDYEQMVRIMASETRFFRRVLSKSILERADRAREQAISSLLESGQTDVNYVLYIGRGDQGGDHDAYRVDRASQLQARCIAAKAVKPDRRYVIGLAMDAPGVRGSSEDFLFIDTKDWTAEDIAQAEKMRQQLGYFLPAHAIETRVVEDEYPGSSGRD
ncbi:MAG: hypothetical protein HZB28_14210 [Methylocystis sp.]|nr:hypothetical protein [Methylocystis sp.]